MQITPEEQKLLQAELSSGESLLWAGKPNRAVIFHHSDWMAIPFSLAWGGFSIFWEASAFGMIPGVKGGNSIFMELWGVPFVLIGQYMIWGRFFHAAWKKGHMVYALTTKRALVLVHSPGFKVVSAYLGRLDAVEKEIRKDGIGTLTFGRASAYGKRGSPKIDGVHDLSLSAGVPVFVDIDEAAVVARLAEDTIVRAQRELPGEEHHAAPFPSFRSL